MNYDANTAVWKSGSLVLHDADAKRPDMLMRVVRYLPDGRCQTEYVRRQLQKSWGRGTRSLLVNENSHLLDPARFGIVVGELDLDLMSGETR